jgi:hypothetical protein
LVRVLTPASGVGHAVPLESSGENVEPLPAVCCADFSRCKESRRNQVTHFDQVFGDHVEPKPQMPGDVLEEAPLGLTLADDAGDVGPEVAGVGLAEPLPGDAERLARIPAMNNVNQPSPRAGVELLEVSPHRCGVKESIRHPGEEDVLRVRFVLDVADGAVAGDGPLEAEVESADAGTEGESIHCDLRRLVLIQHYTPR